MQRILNGLIMKKIFILLVLVLSFTSCIDKLLDPLLKGSYRLYLQEEHFIVTPQKSVYRVGDTINLKIVFPMYLNTESGKQYELKTNEQNLTAMLYKTKYLDSIQVFKNGVRIFNDNNDIQTLKFNKENDRFSLSDNFKLIFERQGIYNLKDILNLELGVNHHQSINYKGDKTFKVEP